MKSKSKIPLRKLKEYLILLQKEPIFPGASQTLYHVFMKHIQTSRENMDEHFESNTSILSFWLLKYEQEKYKLQRLQRRYERMYAAKYLAKKRFATARSTETELKFRVMKDDAELNKLQDVVDSKEYYVCVLKDIVKIMELRHETLINFSATIRKEMSNLQDSASTEKRVARMQPSKRRDVFKRKD